MPKNAKVLECLICDFKCSKQSNLNVHNLTRKHINRTLMNGKKADNTLFYCKTCNKCYRAKNSLWYHEKKCKLSTHDSTNDDTISVNNDDEIEAELANTFTPDENGQMPTLDGKLLLELIKNTQEFKTLLIEQNNKIIELSQQNAMIQNNITNNTTNNSFNLNVFLNEKCKDAVNLMDFVESLQVQLSEFEATGRLGYVEGISKIIINRLQKMEVRKRPIHCTDFKRETMYIKDQDIWEKEDSNKPKLSKAVKIVADKNLRQLNEWQKVYPDSVVNNTKDNDYFVQMMLSILGGRTPEEDERNREKILRNIAREVVIDKTMM